MASPFRFVLQQAFAFHGIRIQTEGLADGGSNVQNTVILGGLAGHAGAGQHKGRLVASCGEMAMLADVIAAVLGKALGKELGLHRVSKEVTLPPLNT